MTDDIPLEIPEAEDADAEALYALLAAAFEYEALLLRVGRTAEPAAGLSQPCAAGRPIRST